MNTGKMEALLKELGTEMKGLRSDLLKTAGNIGKQAAPGITQGGRVPTGGQAQQRGERFVRQMKGINRTLQPLTGEAGVVTAATARLLMRR